MFLSFIIVYFSNSTTYLYSIYFFLNIYLGGGSNFLWCVGVKYCLGPIHSQKAQKKK